MQCPNDGTTLQMTDRQGVEIDYCPTCRGIWLDRGELDKILERSRATADRYDDDDDDYRREPPRGEAPRAGYEQQRPYDRDRDDRPASGHYPPKKKRRGSFLEDLLDFG